MTATPLETTPWHRDRVLLTIIAVAAVMALIYNAGIMIGYAPDEDRHMSYVKLLLHEHTLPYYDAPNVEHGGAHVFHPPLYYLVLAPFYALVQGLPNIAAWHIVRLVSTVLCLAALPLLYQVALVAGRGSVAVARLAVAMIALLPMFGMTAASINNDSACFLAVSVFLWLLFVKYRERCDAKAVAVLGLVMGLGTLCKATALLCDGIAFLTYLIVYDGWSAWRRPQSWARFGGLLVMVTLVAGWWHVRSMKIYGTFTPLPVAMAPPLPDPREVGMITAMAHPNFPQLFAVANGGAYFMPFTTLRENGGTHYFLANPAEPLRGWLQMPYGLFPTIWSQIDWIPAPARFPVLTLLGLFCLVGVLGLLRKEASEDGALAKAARVVGWATLAGFVVNYVTVLQVALFYHWGWAEGGRYLLPSLCGLTILVARGWHRLSGETGLGKLTALWCGGMVALNGVAMYWLIAVLNVKYGPPG